MKLLLILVLFPFIGCTQTPAKNSFTVTVKIDNLVKGDTIYLSYPDYKNEDAEARTDTVIFENDKAIFKGELSEPVEATILRYRIEEVDTAEQLRIMKMVPIPEEELKEMESFLLNPRKPDMLTFFLTPGETTIKAGQSLYKPKIEGSEALKAFLDLKKEYDNTNQELSLKTMDLNLYLKPDSASQEKLMTKMDSISRILKQSIYLNYAINNPNSDVALIALTKAFPNNMDSADKYISVLKKLAPEIQARQSAQRVLKMLEAMKKTEIGRILEDFKQQDIDGRPVQLSSFRGKYVLIELWASWCIPCRRKNPGLIQVSKKFAGKNFTILGVALEEKDQKDKWLTAIKKDGLNWPQVTDFKGWKNDVAVQFGIRSIPFNILIDPRGKIIAKNIYENELESMLISVIK
jgi:thiol-disulfide isomerase/thioredoxin